MKHVPARPLPGLRFSASCFVATALVITAARAHALAIEARSPAAYEALEASGATLVADYGSFRLYDDTQARQKASAAGLPLPQVPKGAVARPEYTKIFFNAGTVETGEVTPARDAAEALAQVTGSRVLFLVKFQGPIRPEWYAELSSLGAMIVDFVPENTYILYGDAKTAQAAAALPGKSAAVRWAGEFKAAWKIAPSVNAAVTDRFEIQLVDDPKSNVATLALLDPARISPILEDYVLNGRRTIVVRLNSAVIASLAARPDVLSIHAVPEPKKNDERQCAIVTNQLSADATTLTGPNHLAWLLSKGFVRDQFDASSFVVDVADSGIDNGDLNPRHPGLRIGGRTAGESRVAYASLQGTPNTSSTVAGCDGHGNLNAHIIAGNAENWGPGFPHIDAEGYRYGMGINPFVSVGASVIFDPTYTSPNIPNMVADVYSKNARISNNSWGASVSGAYTASSQSYDTLTRDADSAALGNQDLTFIFAAGNAGAGASTVGAPGTAKNVITVGASENVHPFGGTDQCGITDADANNPNDVVGFSGRGPCTDGRIKPDLVAPGTHVTGGAPQADAPGINGTALACFDGSGICGGVGAGNSYSPAAQQWYAASSGTSHAAPAVAGGASLIRQWFSNRGRAVPSPALTKAILMNSARYLTGASANDNLWSNSQGMGLLDLDRAIASTPPFVHDQLTIFTGTGQTFSLNFSPIDPTQPVRITLAWTDAPGSTSGNAFRNNLDLVVASGGNQYYGNAFSGPNSTTVGSPDTKNNVESVFLPPSALGSTFNLDVIAANINSDGVPTVGGALDQDFALVVSNGTLARLGSVQTDNRVLDTAGYGNGNGNGALEPGESGVGLLLPIRNFNSSPTGPISGTIVGISPSTARVIQSVSPYGSFVADGVATNTVPFTIAVDASHPCNEPVEVTLRVDGDTTPVLFTYKFRVGELVDLSPVSLLQNPNTPITTTTAVTVVEQFNVTQVGDITKITAYLDVDHTYDNDLLISLVSPAGTTVTLFNRHGSSNDNIRQVTFDDDATTPIANGTPPYGPAAYKPATPLAVLKGEPMEGTWKIIVQDLFAQDGGVLKSAGISIAGQTVKCSPASESQAFTPKVDDLTTSGGWQSTLGADSATLVANGLGNRVHDAYDSYIGLQVNPSSQSRVFGWLENAANDLPYSVVGNTQYARARYAIYYSGPGDSASPTAYNLVPNFRLRLMTRFAVNSMLEVFHNSGTGDPAVRNAAREFGPSKDPFRPSVYRVDLDPVDVPALSTDPNQGLQRGMEVVASLPDFTYVQGTLYLTDSSVAVYPAPNLSLPPVKSYVSAGVAGAADFDNSDIFLTRLTIDRNALFTGVITTSTLSDPAVIAFGAPGGSTVDTRNVPADKIGLAAFDYNAGNASDVGNPANRLRVEAGKMYHVSFRVASSGASSAHPYMRFRARSVKFQWSRLLEINGSRALGSALYQSIAQQTLPGTGSQNPDGDVGGKWYRMVFPTPLDPQIRTDVDGDIATKFPNLSAQPGPGVASSSFRDLKVGFDIADTLSTGAGQETEAANTTVLNAIEIRAYMEIAD